MNAITKSAALAGDGLQHIAEAVDRHAIVSIADANGDITYVNDRLLAISGYTREELMGENHRILRSNRHSPEFYADLWETIMGGDVWQGEICNRRKGGGFYWVRSTIVPFLDVDGAPYKFVSIRTDITNLSEAEQVLRELARETAGTADEEFFAATVKGLVRFFGLRFAMIVERDDLDPAFCKATAFCDSGEMVNNFRHAIPGTPSEKLFKGDRVICHSRFRDRYPDADRLIEIGVESFVGVPLQAFDGSHYGWLCVMHDGRIDTANAKADLLRIFAMRVSSEIDRREALRARARALELLQRSNEVARIGSWEVELATGRLTWSQVTREIHEADEDFECELHDALSFYQAGETRERVEQRFENAVRRNMPFDEECQLVTVTGRLRWVRCIGVPQYSNGRCEHIYGLIQDIDAQKKTELALDVARRDAEHANRAKSDFLARMSHELRTPMNSILGFSQLLEYDSTLSDDHKDTVKEIISAGDHLLTLINEVLDLAKIESGRLEIRAEHVEVAPIIGECLNLVAGLAEQTGVSISSANINKVTIWADRVRIKQALLNLLSNAIKYNSKGGKVIVEAREDDGRKLRISVTDTGSGIPADRMDELFQPFKRLGAENTDIEGTGIGLVLTRRMVEMMGGSLTVESEFGKGSTFCIILPLASLHMDTGLRAASRSPLEANEPAAGSSNAREITILYIEDNPANLRLMAQILSGFERVRLLTAERPEIGIELALEHRPDVVLLDINLPGMSGYEVNDILKASDALAGVPVIAVTANAMPADIDRGRQAGFSDYITKPLDLKQFNTALGRALRNLDA